MLRSTDAKRCGWIAPRTSEPIFRTQQHFAPVQTGVRDKCNSTKDSSIRQTQTFAIVLSLLLTIGCFRQVLLQLGEIRRPRTKPIGAFLKSAVGDHNAPKHKPHKFSTNKPHQDEKAHRNLPIRFKLGGDKVQSAIRRQRAFGGDGELSCFRLRGVHDSNEFGH